MIKKILCLLTAISFFSAQIGWADDPFYDDENDEYFNRGTIVQKESDEFRRRLRLQRLKNWGLAFGTTAIGVTTLILVGKNHKK